MSSKAEALYQEFITVYDSYIPARQAALKARVSRFAKGTQEESNDGSYLKAIAGSLNMTLEFAQEATTNFMPPVFQVRLVRDPNQIGQSREMMTSPQSAVKILRQYLEDLDREHFVILMLDTRNQVIGLHTVHIGTLNSSLVSTRETFKAALLANAAAIILGHNHPSGDPTPSPEDVKVTRHLVEAGKLLEVEVLDHVIIGENGRYTSLKECNLGF